MLKILVFDSGWGGELFADYLEKELAVVEVIRVIDWRHAPHGWYDTASLRTITELMLLPYIGSVDIIVLASYTVTLATLAWLRERYPRQKFIGFELRLFQMLRNNLQKRVLVATNQRIKCSHVYQSTRERLRRIYHLDVVELECGEWAPLIDSDTITDAKIMQTLSIYDWRKDVIALCDTHFVDVKPRLERIFGWKVQVLDDFQYLLEKICYTLKFNRQYARPAGTLAREKRSELKLLDHEVGEIL